MDIQQRKMFLCMGHSIQLLKSNIMNLEYFPKF